MFGTCHTGIVSHRQLIVCQEQIIISIMINYFRTFRSLPTTTHVAGSYQFPIRSNFFPCSTPRLRQFSLYLTTFCIQFHQSDTTMPGTVNQPMFAVLVNKVTRIDGIPFIITIFIIIRCHIKVQSLIRSIGNYIAFIYPSVIVSRIIILHQTNESTFTPGTVTTYCSRTNDRIIHTVQSIFYFTYTRCPVTEIS